MATASGLRVGFDDGSAQEIDLEPVLEGEVYSPLRDQNSGMSTKKTALLLQHSRLADLLAHLDLENGPIEPAVTDEVRRAWASGPLRQDPGEAAGQNRQPNVNPAS